MPLAFLIDEHLRGPLWHGITSLSARRGYPLDVVRVGDMPDLPLGSKDPQILAWAEGAGRILIARDKRTLPKILQAHLAAGGSSPGIMLIRIVPLAELVDFLMCAAYASEPSEWSGQINFVP